MSRNETCCTCKHFTDAGDFDLCCGLDVRRLCYKDDEACEKWETILQLTTYMVSHKAVDNALRCTHSGRRWKRKYKRAKRALMWINGFMHEQREV